MFIQFVLALAAAAAAEPSAPRPLNQQDWVNVGDYPAAALRHDEQGVVAFHLQVSPAGEVVECTITRSSGSATLDAQTCLLVRSRARFEPARDAQGGPTTGLYQQSIRWQLPAPSPEPVVPWAAIERMTISGTGTLLSCTGTELGPVAETNYGSRCRTLQDAPSEVLLIFRGGPGPAPAAVIHEAHFMVEGAPHHQRVHEQPGHQLISLTESRFDITAEGRTENCRIVRREGFEVLHARLCDHMFDGPYVVADGRRRSAGVIIAFSVEIPQDAQAPH